MHSIFTKKYFLIFFEEEQSVSVAEENMLVVDNGKNEIGTKVLVKYGKKSYPAVIKAKGIAGFIILFYFL